MQQRVSRSRGQVGEYSKRLSDGIMRLSDSRFLRSFSGDKSNARGAVARGCWTSHLMLRAMILKEWAEADSRIMRLGGSRFLRSCSGEWSGQLLPFYMRLWSTISACANSDLVNRFNRRGQPALRWLADLRGHLVAARLPGWG